MEQDIDVLTRRAFLRTSLLGAALSWTIPVFLERTFITLNAQAADSSIQAITGKDHPIRLYLLKMIFILGRARPSGSPRERSLPSIILSD